MTVGGAASSDAIRARDQHILYLQYEVSQRDIQMLQLTEQAQQVGKYAGAGSLID